MKKRDEYNCLKRDIRDHNCRYHVDDNPIISDAAYDKLFDRLLEIEAEHIEWVTRDSPSQTVGGLPRKGFAKVKHRIPMLSLQKVHNIEEFLKWDERVRKVLRSKKTKENH